MVLAPLLDDIATTYLYTKGSLYSITFPNFYFIIVNHLDLFFDAFDFVTSFYNIQREIVQ